MREMRGAALRVMGFAVVPPEKVAHCGCVLTGPGRTLTPVMRAMLAGAKSKNARDREERPARHEVERRFPVIGCLVGRYCISQLSPFDSEVLFQNSQAGEQSPSSNRWIDALKWSESVPVRPSEFFSIARCVVHGRSSGFSRSKSQGRLSRITVRAC